MTPIENALIIGDSISIGYTLPKGKGGPTVAPQPKGSACRLRPNGENLFPKEKGGKVQVPLADYEKNLHKLVARMKKSAKKLVWRNTTPVPPGSKGRYAGDSVKFNEAAARVMKKHGVPTLDLYTPSKKNMKEWMQSRGKRPLFPARFASLGRNRSQGRPRAPEGLVHFLLGRTHGGKGIDQTGPRHVVTALGPKVPRRFLQDFAHFPRIDVGVGAENEGRHPGAMRAGKGIARRADNEGGSLILAYFLPASPRVQRGGAQTGIRSERRSSRVCPWACPSGNRKRISPLPKSRVPDC